MSKQEIVCEHKDIQRESGYLYYVSKEGNMTRCPMKPKQKELGTKKEMMHKCNVSPDDRKKFMYFIDGKGNTCRIPYERRTKKQEKK